MPTSPVSLITIMSESKDGLNPGAGGAPMSTTLAQSSSNITPVVKRVKDYDCPFLDAFPVEVRLKIYAAMVPSVSHKIELITSQIVPRRSVYRTFWPLCRTCKKLEYEVWDWGRSALDNYNFSQTKSFGPINTDHTLFAITVATGPTSSCSCIQYFNLSFNPSPPSYCSSSSCPKKRLELLNRPRGKLLSDMMRFIRHVELTFGTQDPPPMLFPHLTSKNAIAVRICKKLQSLEELDVYLPWGLAGELFKDFWNDFGDPTVSYLRIPTSRRCRRVWVNAAAAADPRVTVWHGLEQYDEANSDAKWQKLRSWPRGGGQSTIFPVTDLENGELVLRGPLLGIDPNPQNSPPFALNHSA